MSKYGGKVGRYMAYIKNNLTGQMIYFPVMPQGISETISANFTQQDIVGASAPRIVYSNTSAETINLSLQNLTEDYVAEGFKTLRNYVNALRALAYPVYNGAGVVKSPNLKLCLGTDFSCSCVCTNVSVSWGDLVRDNKMITCSVDLSFIITRGNVPGATYIANGNGVS